MKFFASTLSERLAFPEIEEPDSVRSRPLLEKSIDVGSSGAMNLLSMSAARFDQRKRPSSVSQRARRRRGHSAPLAFAPSASQGHEKGHLSEKAEVGSPRT